MNMDSINDNDIRLKYNDDYDEMENDYNCLDNTNINKSSLNEYKLSEHSIASSIPNSSSTQFSKNGLPNFRTDLDFESVSPLKDKRKRIINENCLMKKHLKSNTLSKVEPKQMDIPYGALCGSQQIGKINLFKLPSWTSLSFSTDSSSSSNLEKIFANLKIRDALTITLPPECENMNVDCTLDHLIIWIWIWMVFIILKST